MFTTYFLNVAAGNLFGSQTIPAIPSIYYLGLSTTAPQLDGTGVTEPSGNAYARVAITALGAPSGGVCVSTADLNFPRSTGDWGTITHYAIFDQATGGNLLIYGTLSPQRSVEVATVMSIEAGSLELAIENATV